MPDQEYYEAEVACRNACPVHTDARGYLLATVAGDYERAYAISRATNPFASICGKVCGAPCEKGAGVRMSMKQLLFETLKVFNR